MLNTFGAKGQITLQLEDKNTGNILQRETIDNEITDEFLMYMLARAMGTAPIANPWRAISKTTTFGQYFAFATSAASTFGMYAMRDIVPVTKGMILRPYINAYNTLSDNVTFHNVAGNATEGITTFIPADSRSGIAFNKDAPNTITVEYIKNTGNGTVRSVIFGGAHTIHDSYFGQLLGEYDHQADWITGRTGTVLAHRLDGTEVWKTVGTSDGRRLHLGTKQMWTGADANPPGWTIANMVAAVTTLDTLAHAGVANLTNRIFRCDYQANTAGVDVTIRLNRWFNSGTAATKDVVLPITAGTSYDTAFRPITIYRPDNDTIEVFMPVSRGGFADGADTIYGANVKKIVFSNLDASVVTNIVETVTDIGIFRIVPSGYADHFRGIGYYDADEERYYFPCPYNINSVTGAIIARQADSHCPGYIFDPTDWSIKGEYLAASGATTATVAPVKTDLGVAFMQNRTAAPYYFRGGQVMHGAVASSDFVKTSDNVLRVIYSITIN